MWKRLKQLFKKTASKPRGELFSVKDGRKVDEKEWDAILGADDEETWDLMTG